MTDELALRPGPGIALVTATERLTRTDLLSAIARRPPPGPRVELVATPTVDTVIGIAAAIAARRPLVLYHPRLPPAQLARQHALAAELAAPPDTLAVVFTSGSTGDPRPISLGRRAAIGAARASAAHLGWRDDDAWLCALPLAHVGGLAIVVRCLAADRPIVLATGGDPEAIAAAAAAGRPTLASVVPAQLAAWLDRPAGRPPRDLGALRAVLLGGAAAPRALREAAAQRGVPFLTTYGMTETWGQVATAPLDHAGVVDPGAGIPLPGVELAAGGPDAPAPIVVRGPMCPQPVTTADLGFVDGRGWLHVAGRADDVIVTGGENVHPATVEDALIAAGASEACVVGLPDPRWGQRVAAAVVLATGATLSTVAERAATALAPHQRPRAWRVVAELPRTATGKVDRRAVAAAPWGAS